MTNLDTLNKVRGVLEKNYEPPMVLLKALLDPFGTKTRVRIESPKDHLVFKGSAGRLTLSDEYKKYGEQEIVSATIKDGILRIIT